MEAALVRPGQVRKDSVTRSWSPPVTSSRHPGAINVIVGERTKKSPIRISNTPRHLGQGSYRSDGPQRARQDLEPAARPRNDPLEPVEPTLPEVLQKYGETYPTKTDPHYFARQDYVKALPNHGKPQEYLPRPPSRW